MGEFTFEVGGQPWARENFKEFPCPYCGRKSVLMSYGDIPSDDLRVELYCDNPDCAAREFNILVRRYGEMPTRSDVTALEEIDKGTASERPPVMLDAVGDYCEYIELASGTLDRRRREAVIEIRPVLP